MADYYPILARAVSGLATNNAQTRQKLYEHARRVLVAQFGGHASQISINVERIALELAILKAETESMRESRPEGPTSKIGLLRSPDKGLLGSVPHLLFYAALA